MVVRSVLPAVLIVSTVVVASLLTSGGDRLGYGDQSCYLDSGLLIGEWILCVFVRFVVVIF